jgi:selenide,water dikinase
VPFIPGAPDLARGGHIPGGTRSNLDFVAPATHFGDLDETERLLLADAQTSGGLLIAVPAERETVLVEALRARGVEGVPIGAVEAGEAGSIAVH